MKKMLTKIPSKKTQMLTEYWGLYPSIAFQPEKIHISTHTCKYSKLLKEDAMQGKKIRGTIIKSEKQFKMTNEKLSSTAA